jgi:hypothetical protein
LISVGHTSDIRKGVGVRHFRIYEDKGSVALQIMILRYPIERRGSGDVEESIHTCIGDRHIGILGDEKITAREVVKLRNATVSQSKQTSGRQVSSHIGVRGLEESVDECILNHEFPKRDFLINPEVWVTSASERDR